MFIKTLKLASLCALSVCLFGAQEDKKSDPPQQVDPYNNEGHIYLGIFGGGGAVTVSNFCQAALVNYPNSGGQGGPQNVSVYGGGKSTAVGMAGAQLGYLWPEFKETNSKRQGQTSMNLATEAEAYYVGFRIRRNLDGVNNWVTRYYSTFPIDGGVFLGSFVGHFGMNCESRYHFFIGGAAGASILLAHDASSYQTRPANNLTLNIFNSNRSDSAWVFAAQGKAGVMYHFTEFFKISGEYRFLYLTPARFTFGSTVADNIPTTNRWRVKFGNSFFNMGDLGFTFSF